MNKVCLGLGCFFIAEGFSASFSFPKHLYPSYPVSPLCSFSPSKIHLMVRSRFGEICYCVARLFCLALPGWCIIMFAHHFVHLCSYDISYAVSPHAESPSFFPSMAGCLNWATRATEEERAALFAVAFLTDWIVRRTRRNSILRARARRPSFRRLTKEGGDDGRILVGALNVGYVLADIFPFVAGFISRVLLQR